MEGNIKVWLPLVRPPLGTWPATQACALTGNQTSDLLVHRPELNPQSHTSQGQLFYVSKSGDDWNNLSAYLQLHPTVRAVLILTQMTSFLHSEPSEGFLQ